MHKWFSLALTCCSQLHSAQLEQWNDASVPLYRAYICAVTNVIWKLFMATSIGAKGIENRHVIESIQNVQKSNDRSGKAQVNHTRMFSTWKRIAWLLLCAFKDRHLKMQRQSYKHSLVLFTFNFFLMISFQNTFLRTSPFLSANVKLHNANWTLAFVLPFPSQEIYLNVHANCQSASNLDLCKNNVCFN